MFLGTTFVNEQLKGQQMLNKETMKQRGFFRCGAGINKRRWIEDAQKEGYITLDCGEYVELWATK